MDFFTQNVRVTLTPKPSYVRSAGAVGAIRRSARGRRRRPCVNCSWAAWSDRSGSQHSQKIRRLSDFLVSYSMHKVRNRCLTDLHRTLP